MAANYRRAGIRLFVLGTFVRHPAELRACRRLSGSPLWVARLIVPLTSNSAPRSRRYQRAAHGLAGSGVMDRGVRGRWHRGCAHQERPFYRSRCPGCDHVPRMALSRRATLVPEFRSCRMSRGWLASISSAVSAFSGLTRRSSCRRSPSGASSGCTWGRTHRSFHLSRRGGHL